MKVFLSWSGGRSKAVAELLNVWIKCVLQATKPWISSRDIDRGSLWFAEIGDQLKDTSIGILCLTQENKDKPWILFEAGALAKGLTSNRVCTLLIDLKATDIKDPLAQFNHTLPEKDSLRTLVKTLNSALGHSSLDDRVLDTVFDTYWPQFEEQFSEIIEKVKPSEAVERRSDASMLEEILEATRGLSQRLQRVEERTHNDRAPKYSRSDVTRMIREMIEAGIPDVDLTLKLAKLYGMPRTFAGRRIADVRTDISLVVPSEGSVE